MSQSDSPLVTPSTRIAAATIVRSARSLLIDASYAMPGATQAELRLWTGADDALVALIKELAE